VLKVFHTDTSASSIDVELAALSASATAHVVRLIDIATVETGEPPCLVLERLPGPTLSLHLDDQRRLTAGQAVTVLAPLCAAVHALHEAGITHGAIHLRRIVFDQRGAPVLTGFGRGALRASPRLGGSIDGAHSRPRSEAPPESPESAWRSAVLADHRGLLSVIDDVLARVDPAELRGFDVVAATAEIGIGPSADFLARVEGRLFAMATPDAVILPNRSSVGRPVASTSPEPTEFDAFVSTTPPIQPLQTIEYDWQQPITAPSPAPAESRLIAALRILGASSSVLEIVSRLVDATTRRSKRMPSDPSASPVDTSVDRQGATRRLGGRPLLVGAFCTVVAATTLLLALPAPRDQAQADVDVAASIDPSGAVGSTDEPQNEALGVDATLVQADDPADALHALSAVTEGCAATAEPEACLVDVFQHDYLATRVDPDSPLVIDASDASVTGAWGGSALVAARLNDQPASFLLMKDEAGWQVRDVFVSDQ